tara:strand:+ start:1204 stop:1545 length:342 start_codon:yes stop_codon:yes gene_type:complete
MANEENLIPYEKGQSGNPKGRPKGSKNRSTVAKRWLQVEQDLKNPLTSEIETMSQEDLMTLALIKKAREGDTQAYQKLLDSAYGAPVQQVEQTNIELPFFNLDADRNDGSKED